jgi:hypothetical protein
VAELLGSHEVNFFVDLIIKRRTLLLGALQGWDNVVFPFERSMIVRLHAWDKADEALELRWECCLSRD